MQPGDRLQQEETYPFNETFQRQILALTVRSTLLRDLPGCFQSKFFGTGDERLKSPMQQLAEIIEKFAAQHHNERIDVAVMDDLVQQQAKRMKPAERHQFESEWQSLRNLEVANPNYVMQRMRWWARDQAIRKALYQSSVLVDKHIGAGEEIDIQAVSKMVEQANSVGSANLHGSLMYGEDGMYMWRESPTLFQMPSGFRALDLAMDGGPRRKEVVYFLAPPKGAKTAALLNVALNVSRNRRGVAYFTFEMDEPSIIMRMHRNIAVATKQELRKSTTPLEKAMLALKSFGAGQIHVKYYSPLKFGCAEVTRFVERKRAEGASIDVVIMDYLNLMAPAQREHEKRHALAAISREMSALARELDVVVWSAALVKRTAVDKDVVRKSDIAEAFEVISVVDGAIAICGPADLKTAGFRRLYLTALRNNDDEHFAGLYKIDLDRMRFREATREERSQVESKHDTQ